MRRLVCGLVVLLLAACGAPGKPQVGAGADSELAAPPALVQTLSDPVPQEVLNKDANACAAANGKIMPVCLRGLPMCVVTFADAGKSCTDSSQCSGRCLAEGDVKMDKPATGTCAPTNNPCGCHALVANGIAQPVLCVD